VLPILPSPRFPKDQLINVVQTIAGVQVVWRTAARPLLAQRPGTEWAWIMLSVQSYVSVGIDELRQQLNAQQTALDSIVVGLRHFTLVCRAYSIDATLQAFDLLERVRFRIRSATAHDLMVPTVALRDMGEVRPLDDATIDLAGSKRTLLAAMLDIRMACVLADDPRVAGEGDFIETANGGGLIPGTATP
jgi:hypothetical protein